MPEAGVVVRFGPFVFVHATIEESFSQQTTRQERRQI
jgi:hypothetical protein